MKSIITNAILCCSWLSINQAMAQEPEFPEPETPRPRTLPEKIPIADGPEGLGLGAAVGEPTGIAIALRPIPTFTTAGVFGWNFGESKLHMHVDFLYTLKRLEPSESVVTVDLFTGAGPTLNLGADSDDNAGLGVRVVGGASVNFNEKPFDLYVDIAPVVGLIPETRMYFNASLGFRGWFIPPEKLSPGA